MDDDDKQPSHERLDETNPERNRRSFFDWLRGKEETDEEKLRKKLDEELKEAARRRATDFEEEQRAEEKREVSETKKLKKRWRAKLVEKSKRLLEEATERGDEPTNGYEIAKLMVAERIVKLHEILTTEDLRKSEMKSIKIHIDFMGLLSEKLDRPELEVPEEIEELFQTIAESVEEATGEAPPATPRSEPETAPVSEADAAYTAFATSIVQAIRRAVQSQTTPEPSNAGDGGDAETASTPRTRTTTAPQRQPERVPEEQRVRLTEQLLNIVKGSALSGEAIKHEISHTEHARKLADVAEKAAMIDRFVTKEVKKPLPTPPTNAETDMAGSDLEPKHVEKPMIPLLNKKVKYMTELELITLAETVQVPGGRILSDIYKKGEIDRDGLIKVLKSYTKGWDYRSEFVLQRDKWQRHKAESPEYLTQPVPTQNPTPAPTSTSTQSSTSTTTPKKGSASTQKKRVLNAQGSNFSPEHSSASISQETTEPEEAIPEYHPTPGSSTVRRLRNLTRPSVIGGKLRNIGLSRSTPGSPDRNISKAQLLQNVKERIKRQSQMTLLLFSMLLLIIIIIAVIELSSL